MSRRSGRLAGAILATSGLGEHTAMSQRTVQLLIGQIVTDEDLRRQFIAAPAETLAAVRAQGLELTRLEIQALIDTEPSVWEMAARTIHPRLQRCSLTHEAG
jgi:hypothetical protein